MYVYSCEIVYMCANVSLKEAEKAKAALDGKKALGKKIVVDWARFDPASKKNVRL